jgi:hypothetical protein
MGGDFEKVVQFAQRLEQFCDIRILCCFNQTLLETIILLKLYTLLITVFFFCFSPFVNCVSQCLN